MDMEIDTCKVTNTVVKWKVAVPRLDRSVESNSFQVYGYNWKLELVSSYNNNKTSRSGNLLGEHWSMILYYSDNKGPTTFYLASLIRDKGRDVCLSKDVIRDKRTEVWCFCYSNFREKYPDIQVVGNLLQFVFYFHLGIPDPETPIKEKKSVQTSEPNTGTKYPDNHPCLENLSLDLSKLVEDGTDTDVLLKCGDVSIEAHKVILGARSEVFRTMLQSDMVEGREGIVEIIDMQPKLLKIFIRYIYTGNLPDLTVDTALPIYEAADKYQVEALKKRCSQFLVKNLSPENALGIIAMADAHSDSELKDQLVPYIIKEKMPTRKAEWLKFCNECPKLAVEVLNFFYDLPSVSQ